jgi:hypothetical protein
MLLIAPLIAVYRCVAFSGSTPSRRKRFFEADPPTKRRRGFICARDDGPSVEVAIELYPPGVPLSDVDSVEVECTAAAGGRGGGDGLVERERVSQ